MNDTLHVPLPDKHIRLVWKGINEAMVFNDSNTSDANSASNTLIKVTWQSSMHHPILRYLAIQSYLVFEAAQSLTKIDLDGVLDKSKEYRAILSECESQISQEIAMITTNEQQDDQGETDEDKEDRYAVLTAHCNMIRDFQMIWHLAEIFFIKLSCAGYFVHDLKYWLMLQQPHISHDYNALVDFYNTNDDEYRQLECNERYWPTVWALALHGRKEELLNLLACHTHCNAQAFRSVREVIAQMPVFDDKFAKNGTFEFDHCWNSWSKAARTHLTEGFDLLASYPELELVASIVMGNREAFFDGRVIDVAEGCWFYAVVSFLWYCRPLADARVVSDTFKDFRRQFLSKASSVPSAAGSSSSRSSASSRSETGIRPPEEGNGTDQERTANFCSPEILGAIESAFDIDLGQFVSFISRSCNSWWMCAHLVDLIDKINPHLFPWQGRQIKKEVGSGETFSRNLRLLTDAGDGPSQIFNDDFIDRGEVGSLREFFILKYASGFVSHPAMTMKALKYFHFCPRRGPAYIEQIVDRLEMRTEKFSTMIHTWCQSHKYESIARSICKRRAVQAFKSGLLGNSLVWAIRGGDSAFVSRIADQLLRELFKSEPTRKTKETGALEINDQSSGKIVVQGMMDCVKNMNLGLKGKKITFVVRFYEVLSLIEQNKHKEAAQSLVHLLESQLVSSHFNLDILSSTRSLLTVEGVFSTSEIYQLMEVLEQAQGRCDSSRVLEVQQLREILVQQLSRACLRT